MNETTSMTKVYAVFAMPMEYYDGYGYELCKIFGAMGAAEAYAQELRELTNEEGDYEGDNPQPAFARVKVEAYSVN